MCPFEQLVLKAALMLQFQVQNLVTWLQYIHSRTAFPMSQEDLVGGGHLLLHLGSILLP
uniref:Flowering time control protein FPA isoform X2 n=1 Tax=Rhizophora mucronata TaxID=61149 RepID=A0A2P2M7D2_RHIMU